MEDVRLTGIGLHRFPSQNQNGPVSTFVNNAKERLKAEPAGKLAAAGTVGAFAGAAIAVGLLLFAKSRKPPS